MNGTVWSEAMEEALRQELTAKGLQRPKFAVVVPVVPGVEDLRLLVEVRAAGISQAGDPCFPGGRVEPGETPARAAARELREELGITVDPARFLGQLPTVQTYLGSMTDVFVCTVAPEQAADLQINPDEVSELLEVPLSWLLDRAADSTFPRDGHVIWGMTAGAIRHFCRAWMRAEAWLRQNSGR